MRLGKMISGALVLVLVPAVASEAAVLDNMDDTSHFSAAFGAASVVDNSNGMVTLTKSAGANVDSGVIWSAPGEVKVDLVDSEVEIIPAVLGEDFININAIFFDAGDNFVNQALVLSDTNLETPINFDVAPSAGSGAASYVLQIRILPFGAENASYTFDSISAGSEVIPEPASLALLAAGGLCCFRRRRSA